VVAQRSRSLERSESTLARTRTSCKACSLLRRVFCSSSLANAVGLLASSPHQTLRSIFCDCALCSPSTLHAIKLLDQSQLASTSASHRCSFLLSAAKCERLCLRPWRSPCSPSALRSDRTLHCDGCRVPLGAYRASAALQAQADYAEVAGSPYTVSFDHRAIAINGQRTLLQSGCIHYPRSTPDVSKDCISNAARAWFVSMHSNQCY
jgi:hypothetical protein